MKLVSPFAAGLLAQGARPMSRVTCAGHSSSIADFFRRRAIDDVLADRGALLLRDVRMRADKEFSQSVNVLATQRLICKERPTRQRKTASAVDTNTDHAER